MVMCRLRRGNIRATSSITPVGVAAPARTAAPAPLQRTRILKPTDPSGQPATSFFSAPQRGCPEPLGASIDPDTVRCARPPPLVLRPTISPHPTPSHPHPHPPNPTLPAAPLQGAANFALFSSNAWAVSLCLFTEGDLAAGRVTLEVALDPDANRTGDTWHVALPNADTSLLYGYRVGGPQKGDAPATAGQAFDTVSAAGIAGRAPRRAAPRRAAPPPLSHLRS
jgi:isoamylase